MPRSGNLDLCKALSYVEAHYQLANTQLKTNNKESARQSLEKALQADPGNLKFQELYNKVLAS